MAGTARAKSAVRLVTDHFSGTSQMWRHSRKQLNVKLLTSCSCNRAPRSHNSSKPNIRGWFVLHRISRILSPKKKTCCRGAQHRREEERLARLAARKYSRNVEGPARVHEDYLGGAAIMYRSIKSNSKRLAAKFSGSASSSSCSSASSTEEATSRSIPCCAPHVLLSCSEQHFGITQSNAIANWVVLSPND